MGRRIKVSKLNGFYETLKRVRLPDKAGTLEAVEPHKRAVGNLGTLLDILDGCGVKTLELEEEGDGRDE